VSVSLNDAWQFSSIECDVLVNVINPTLTRKQQASNTSAQHRDSVRIARASTIHLHVRVSYAKHGDSDRRQAGIQLEVRPSRSTLLNVLVINSHFRLSKAHRVPSISRLAHPNEPKSDRFLRFAQEVQHESPQCIMANASRYSNIRSTPLPSKVYTTSTIPSPMIPAWLTSLFVTITFSIRIRRASFDRTDFLSHHQPSRLENLTCGDINTQKLSYIASED
jgi:hypothetical protein